VVVSLYYSLVLSFSFSKIKHIKQSFFSFFSLSNFKNKEQQEREQQEHNFIHTNKNQTTTTYKIREEKNLSLRLSALNNTLCCLSLM